MDHQKILAQLMLAVLATHELDAVSQSEWRLLYVLRGLSDEQGRWWFVLLHIPLFWGLIAATQNGNSLIRRISGICLAAFCVVHAGLHARLAGHPLATFDSPLSLGLIWGAAAIGVVFLANAARVAMFKPDANH